MGFPSHGISISDPLYDCLDDVNACINSFVPKGDGPPSIGGNAPPAPPKGEKRGRIPKAKSDFFPRGSRPALQGAKPNEQFSHLKDDIDEGSGRKNGRLLSDHYINIIKKNPMPWGASRHSVGTDLIYWGRAGRAYCRQGLSNWGRQVWSRPPRYHGFEGSLY